MEDSLGNIKYQETSLAITWGSIIFYSTFVRSQIIIFHLCFSYHIFIFRGTVKKQIKWDDGNDFQGRLLRPQKAGNRKRLVKRPVTQQLKRITS